MRNIEVSDAMYQVITIILNLKPGESANVQADLQGRADTFMVTQHSKRIVFNNKQVWQEVKDQK